MNNVIKRRSLDDDEASLPVLGKLKKTSLLESPYYAVKYDKNSFYKKTLILKHLRP